MSEEKKEKLNDGLEVTYRIPVERFQYQDELAEENRRLEKRNHYLVAGMIVLCTVTLFAGWLMGSFRPLSIANPIRQGSALVSKKDSRTKIENIMRIMENYWYFANGIDNLEERLTDQALIGITTNEEDPHTSYMSREEIEAFTQSINRNFVGIGVQFQNHENGLNIITRVFPNSPAEKAGVQAGDIIHSVDGEIVEGYTSDKIKEVVQGEEGTDVNIGFLREGKLVSLTITRAQVAHTVSGEVREEDIGYLQIEQFGETTATELKSYLDEFESSGVQKLIIDVRDDGGGYLEALKGVVGCFLPAKTTIINRDYTDGTHVQTVTDGGMYTQFSPIVILVNENTASAAEAFTMAMREQREDVRIVGVTTYGKGSVQITQYYDDGTALKYTDSIWKSPDGVWVNGAGITPDETVELHEVLNTVYASMTEEDVVKADEVSEFVSEAQLCLDFLGYAPDRTDGYFSEKTLKALQKFEADYELEETDELNESVYSALISAVVRAWSMDQTNDKQYQKAVELVKEGIVPETDETGEGADTEEGKTAEGGSTEEGKPSSSVTENDALLYEAVDHTLVTRISDEII